MSLDGKPRSEDAHGLLKATDTPSDPPSRVRLSGKALEFVGYAHGLRQPAVQYTLTVADHDPGRLGLVGPWMPAVEPALPTPGTAEPPRVVQCLVSWTTALLRDHGHLVFQPACVLSQAGSMPCTVIIVQPCLAHRDTLRVVGALVEVINLALEPSVTPEWLSAAVPQRLSELTTSLRRTGLQGFNPQHLLAAAVELGVPWRQLHSGLFQLGHGANARWLDSSWTDRTATIGAYLARDKGAASAVLRLNGLPVPDHGLAGDADVAVRHAESLGYPVVVKPANLDGGVGVTAGLDNADEVRAAFAEARALSERVLVEKHVPGRDYRLLVVDGQVLGLLERVPGGVVGNGQDPVKTLLERQNHERATAVDDRRHLHTMAFDDEARKLLAAIGMDGDSVPAQGQVVRLRKASNVASGGIPVPLPLESADPDNLRLAVRAARALRLDVAGIDLLMDDIGQSWLHSGAHICEVNSKPQLFTSHCKPLLTHLMRGGSGRIPVVIVVEPDRSGHEMALHIHEALLADGTVAGLASRRHATLGRDLAFLPSPDVLGAARMLLLDATLQTLVIALTEADTLTGGWPVDACDVLVLCPPGGAASAAKPAAGVSNWVARSRHLRPALVLIDASDAAGVRQARTVFEDRGVVTPVACQTRAQRLAAAAAAVAWLRSSSRPGTP